MITRVLLGTVSVVALIPASFAADIYSPAPVAAPPILVPLPSWAGFYVGVNGGYGGNNSSRWTEDVFPSSFTTTTTPYALIGGKTTIDGGFGGGQLGYNFQWGSWVAGFETDIQGSSIKGSGEATIFNPTTSATFGFPGVCGAVPANATSLTGVCSARNDINVDYFGTVRARIGYAWGGVLLYGTGGFAYGGVKSGFSYTDNNTFRPMGAPLTPQFARFTNSNTQTGWVAGAGIEYKIAPNWSLKGEYQFIDLGSATTRPSETFFGSSSVNPCATNTASISCRTARGHLSDVSFNTVRVGVNYYFNTPYEPLPLK
ncbi:MAG: outer membrane beta-barrel protein [Rhodomicrobium sp.]